MSSRAGVDDVSALGPSVVHPRAPVAVQLSSVSDAELGVSFMQPRFIGGGGAVEKFLVEYSTDRTFPQSGPVD